MPVLEYVGFAVTVYDPRQELAERFSDVICAPYAELEDHVTLTPYDSVVVMTPGHMADFEVLHRILRHPLSYIGCIGSRNKAAKTRDLLRQEGKERQGHLDHTLHLIADLHNLHLQLMKLPAGARYRELYARLEPELPRLRAVLGRNETSDTELCFRALYAAMLYRIRGEGGQQAVADTVEYISPAIAELASMYGKVERGEIDLFEREK